MGIAKVLTCDNCKKHLKNNQGAFVPAGIRESAVDNHQTPSGDYIVPAGTYCWNCLLDLLGMDVRDPSCDLKRLKEHSESYSRSFWKEGER